MNPEERFFYKWFIKKSYYMKRDNFSTSQKIDEYALSAISVQHKWPTDSQLHSAPHFICVGCNFVSDDKNLFNIDHVYPCALGGSNNKFSKKVWNKLLRGDLNLFHQVGWNAQVLCKGCNGSKGRKEFIPSGVGYAYTKHDKDKNPDHCYHGKPSPL
jgi:hypothetical protein